MQLPYDVIRTLRIDPKEYYAAGLDVADVALVLVLNDLSGKKTEDDQWDIPLKTDRSAQAVVSRLAAELNRRLVARNGTPEVDPWTHWVRRLLVEQLGCEPLKNQDMQKSLDDMGCDSLDMVELVMAMEDEHDITVTDEDAAALRTPQDIVDILHRKGVQL